jgi:hypothetical protein
MRARTIAAMSVAVALGGGMAVFGPAVSASAKNPPNLQGLTNEINKAKHETYYVVYKSVQGSQVSTVTIAQQPPKSLFDTGGGNSVISTGKTTYICSPNSGNSGSTGNTGNSGNSGNSGSTTTTTTKPKSTEQCYSEKGANPLLGAEAVFSPALVTGIFAQAEESTIARALGIHVTYSSASFGGVPSTCISVTRKGQTAKYCVTSQGILAYSGSGKNTYFELTKYSSHPPAGAFQLPAGATTSSSIP